MSAGEDRGHGVRPRPGCGVYGGLGARAAGGFVLPTNVAGQGCCRGGCAHHAAGPAGYGVCRTGGPAADHRAVHVDHVPARLRGARPVADPGAGPGFLARADDRRDDPAADGRRRRPRAGGRAGLDARDHGRGDHDRGGGGEARVYRRPDLQADDDRLHERPGADHPGRPAAEAIRVQGRGRWLPRRGHRLRQGPGPRSGGCRRGRGRDRRDRSDPGAAAVAAETPGRADHGGGRDRGDIFSLAEHGVSLVGVLPKGFPP